MNTNPQSPGASPPESPPKQPSTPIQEHIRPYVYGMLAGSGAIILSIAFFFAVYRYQGFGSAIAKVMDILSPFTYGAAIAYLIKPICNTYDELFEQHFPARLKRFAQPLSIALAMITGALIVYAVIIMILPDLVQSVMSVAVTLPSQITDFIRWLESLAADNPDLVNYIETSYEAVQASITVWLQDTFAPTMQHLVNDVGTRLWSVVLLSKNLFIGIIVTAYLLGSRRKFARQAKLLLYSAVKTPWADWILKEVAFADRMFAGFISGKLLDSAIIGVLCYIVCILARFPNPLLISAIIGVTNVIPFFGPFIGAVPSILLIFIESPVKAFWFAVFVLILQQIDGNIIGPKILGDSTGLSSFWVLFSILLFGGLWGFVGMIIAVPLFAVIYDIIEQLMRRGLRHHGREDLLEAYGRDFCQPEQQKPSLVETLLVFLSKEPTAWAQNLMPGQNAPEKPAHTQPQDESGAGE